MALHFCAIRRHCQNLPHYYIGEGASVSTEDGCHVYLRSFPPSLCEGSFEAKVRTSSWSVLESTLICFRAKARARSAVWVGSSRRASVEGGTLSWPAAPPTFPITSSARLARTPRS